MNALRLCTCYFFVVPCNLEDVVDMCWLCLDAHWLLILEWFCFTEGSIYAMSGPDGGGVSSSEETSQSFSMKRAVFMQSSSTTTSSSGSGPVQTQGHSVSTMSEQVSKKADNEPALNVSFIEAWGYLQLCRHLLILY